MLSLGHPDAPPDPAVLDAPGGFSWWYADLMDEAGNGAVLIGAWGLPFLPGYAGAARDGRGQPAGSRPSINLALYRAGRPCFYLLQETEGAWESAERWRFGESVLESRIEAGERSLVATLDCPVAGSSARLRGRFEVRGPARMAQPGEGDPGAHRWTPLAGPARGVAVFSTADFTFRAEGRAYHDRNECVPPLHELGIGEWLWGRAPAGDAEVVWYLLWPADGGPVVAWGLEIAPDGTTRPVDTLRVTTSDRRRARYGLAWWDTLVLTRDDTPWITVRHGPAVEDGPFYLRFLPRVTRGPDAARGVAELVRPDRVDHPWMRPFVRMRVRGDASSMWLPLFEGPASGRVARLVDHWRGVG